MPSLIFGALVKIKIHNKLIRILEFWFKAAVAAAEAYDCSRATTREHI